MNDFAAFVRSLGLRPRQVLADGRWRRCPTENHPKKRNGAYKLAIDGRVGFVQDWATMQEPAVWRVEAESKLPVFDVEAFRRAEQDALKARQEAVAACRSFYTGLPLLRGGHPYLASHGLDMTGCMGLRVDGDGWLVVPAMRGRMLQSVQRIAPDGEKRFWPGAQVAGTSYAVVHRQVTITVLCEGLATGLACFAALPNSRVIVCWNAGNMARTELRPTGLVVIAADNDHETAERIGKNPGLDAAQAAARLVGCGVAHPYGITGTDWADWRQEKLALRLPRRGPYETAGKVQHAVDAELAGELLRRAVFVAPR